MWAKDTMRLYKNSTKLVAAWHKIYVVFTTGVVINGSHCQNSMVLVVD